MLEVLNIPTLAARIKQLKLCTLYIYVHGLSVDLTIVRPFARFMYSFFPQYDFFVEQLT